MLDIITEAQMSVLTCHTDIHHSTHYNHNTVSERYLLAPYITTLVSSNICDGLTHKYDKQGCSLYQCECKQLCPWAV